MRDSPCVSIVVPFFDSDNHIRACIESLLGQQDVGEEYEIILVDNGSTDASASIVGEYSGLTVLEETTPGAYAARNTGIRAAKAPLIAFTDADCAVSKNWLRSIRKGMKDPTTAILIGYIEYPQSASTALKILGAYENAKAEYVTAKCDANYHFAYNNNMAVRASVFQELGLFQEWRRGADSELVHRLAARKPDLKLSYHPSMRVAHLEFVRGHTRAGRLRRYRQSNAKIQTFRELGVAQRAGVLFHWLRGGGKG